MVQQAGGDVAFFRFDTNADAVASDVAGAMARINASLSQPVAEGELARNIGGLGITMSRVEQDLQRNIGRITNLLGRAGAGMISKADLQGQLRDTIGGAVGNLPNLFADALATAPEAVARRVDMKSVASRVGQDYIDTLTEYIRDNRALAGDALRGVPLQGRAFEQKFDFSDQKLKNLNNPVAYGSESSSVSELINRVRAEKLASEVVSQQRSLKSLGNSGFESYVQGLIGSQSRVTESGVEFVPSGAAAELGDLVRRERDAAATANRLGKEREKLILTTQQLAMAEELLATSTAPNQKFAGLRQLPSGLWVKGTAAGAAEETNPLKISDASAAKEKYETEVANAKRLADNFERVVDVNGYSVLGDEVYRINKYGAERIQNEYLVNRVLEAQEEKLRRQSLQAQRLNELSQARILREERNNSGFVGGFNNRLHRGEQSLATGLGGQLASAAAFSVAYGSLFAVQNAIRDTISEFVDYQDSLTDLEVATRSADVVTNDWVDSLSELSRLSGSNPGAALDSAARGVRAFADFGAPEDQIRKVGTATEEAATKLALIANKSLQDATGDIVSIGSSFQLESDQLIQIVDAVSSAKRNLGGDPAQVAQGLSLIAGAATEAGYNLNEAAAVMSLVQARTDQSGQAIATRLQRIFQIVQGSTGKALGRELGIDTNADTKDQLEQYAKIYSNEGTSEPVRDRIASALGGTANLRELLPLLKENKALQDAYADALNNAGAGTDEFNRKTGNVVGTLKKLKGDLTNIQVDLARSGLFAPFGAALDVLEPAIHAIDLLIKGYNRLLDLAGEGIGLPVQELVGFAVNLAIAGKAISIFSKAGGMGTIAKTAIGAELGAMTVQRATVEAGMNRVIVGATGTRAAAEAAGAAGEAGGGLFAGTRAGLKKLLGGILTPKFLGGAAVVGGLVGIEKLYESKQSRTGFLSDFGGSQNIFGRIDSTEGSSSIRDAADELQSVAAEIRKSGAGLFSDQRDSILATIDSQSKWLKEAARRVSAEEVLAAQTEKTTSKIAVFGNGAIETVAQLAEGMGTLAAGGQTALGQVRALREALSTPPPRGGEIFRPEAVATEIITAATGALAQSIPESVEGYRNRPEGAAFYNPLTGKPYQPPQVRQNGPINPLVDLTHDEALAGLSLDKADLDLMRSAIDKQLSQEQITGGILTDEQKQRLVDVALKTVDFSTLPRDAKEITDSWLQQTINGLKFSSDIAPSKLLNSKKLTPDDILTILNPSEGAEGQQFPGFLAAAKAGMDAIPSSDDGRTAEAEAKANLKFLRTLKSYNTGADVGQLEYAIAEAEHEYRNLAVTRIQRLREAAEAAAKSRKGLKAVRLKFAKQAFKAAGNDVPLLISLMESLDLQTINQVLDYLRTAREVARQAYEHARSLVTTAVSAFRDFGSEQAFHGGNLVDPENSEGKKKNLKRIKSQIAAAENALKNSAITELTPPDPPAVAAAESSKKTKEDKKKEAEDAAKEAQDRRDAAADRTAAIAGARAARLGGGLASARAALTSAAAKLHAQKKGTTEWYQALASFYQAQEEMRNAIADYAYVQDQLRGDITDPVENARDALRNARRRLAQDQRSGAGEDVRAADRLALRQADNELASQKFNQRLSDMQTAEELGRISFSKYMSYLDHEHDRLSRIKHRTRQQQDQLDEISRAMREAASSMDSQFNLGDINTNGLVYQVRRFKAEAQAQRASSSVASNVQTTNQTVTISVNGADVAKVQGIIDRYLGIGKGQNRTLSRRKV